MPEPPGDQPRVVWSAKHKAYVPVEAERIDDGHPDDAVRALERPVSSSRGERPPSATAPKQGKGTDGDGRRHYVIRPEQGRSSGGGSDAAPSNRRESAGSSVVAHRAQAPATRSTPPRPPAPPSRSNRDDASRTGRTNGRPPPPPTATRGRARGGGRPAGTARGSWTSWFTRRRIVALALGVVVGIPLLVLAFGWWQFNRIERVDTAGALSGGGGAGTNYLVVGSDTREGIDADDPNADAFIGSTVTGERTDTIMVLRMEGDRSYLLSIPRDLWVTNAATGEQGRINAVYRSGPPALIRTVQDNVGIPIHHYLEIDFVSFGGLVDAVGGITVDFPHPARDDASGLLVEQTGPVTLDGTQALAYVRSRTYTELIDGEWRTDPTGDLGRTERQRIFLAALLSKATGSRNPIALMQMSSALGGGLAIDDTFTFFGALRLAWDLRGFSPESVVLPTTPRTTSGGAAVLDIDEPAAAPLVQQFSS